MPGPAGGAGHSAGPPLTGSTKVMKIMIRMIKTLDDDHNDQQAKLLSTFSFLWTFLRRPTHLRQEKLPGKNHNPEYDHKDNSPSKDTDTIVIMTSGNNDLCRTSRLEWVGQCDP